MSKSKNNSLNETITGLALQKQTSSPKTIAVSKDRYNEDFIELLGELNQLLLKKGDFMRARAYQKAQESIINYSDNIWAYHYLVNPIKTLLKSYVKSL